MKKLFNYTGEQFILKEGTLEEIREKYNKQTIYLSYKARPKADTSPRIWYLVDERTEENRPRTWIYCAGITEVDFPVYEKVAYSLGYLYDEKGLKWIRKIRGYSEVRKEDVF